MLGTWRCSPLQLLEYRCHPRILPAVAPGCYDTTTRRIVVAHVPHATAPSPGRRAGPSGCDLGICVQHGGRASDAELTASYGRGRLRVAARVRVQGTSGRGLPWFMYGPAAREPRRPTDTDLRVGIVRMSSLSPGAATCCLPSRRTIENPLPLRLRTTAPGPRPRSMRATWRNWSRRRILRLNSEQETLEVPCGTSSTNAGA